MGRPQPVRPVNGTMSKNDIPYRPLGPIGLKVSALGGGGHHLGDARTTDEAIKLVHEAIDAGMNIFDNWWEYSFAEPQARHVHGL